MPLMFRCARAGHRIVALAAAWLGCLVLLPSAQTPVRFADRIAALSEPGGYFDTDNLISNEASYVRVVPELVQRKVRGGAYIGVGPDQNFTYIAATRPSIAFILDIRRDNMLLHLLFKALFASADTRVHYLSLLCGRAAPATGVEWAKAPVEQIVAHVEGARPSERDIGAARATVNDALARTGVPLSAEDLHTIDRFHRRFIDAGLNLRFQSTGRPPRSYYPTYRELLTARDPSGAGSFLATEESFRFLKRLHQQDLIVPVVGDVSGPKALAAIGALLAERRERLSAFYVSNVEFYLFGDGRLSRYLENLGRIPRAPNAVIIRSAFGPYASGSGSDYSSSHVQSLDELLQRARKGDIVRYTDLLR
jgi:hypothetical protein